MSRPPRGAGPPKVLREGPDAHPGVAGRLGAQLLRGQEAVQAVQDAGETDSLPPQGRRDWVDSTELWHQDLRRRQHVDKHEANTEVGKNRETNFTNTQRHESLSASKISFLKNIKKNNSLKPSGFILEFIRVIS